MTVVISAGEFLRTLWGDQAGVAELTTIKSKVIRSYPFTYPDSIESLIGAAGRHSGKINVYMGVCLRREPWPRKNPFGGTDERGTEENALSAGAVWIDIDFPSEHHKGNTTEPEVARKLIAEFKHQPSIVVKSGSGLHLYWLLRELATGEDLKRVKVVNASLSRHFDSDSSVKDLARILRIPGTLNVNCNPPVLCEVESFFPERRYILDDFDFLPKVEPKKSEPRPAQAPNAPAIEIPEESLRKIESLLTEMWMEGWRHDMALDVSGMLAHAGVQERFAIEIVQNVSNAVGGDTENRLKDVEDTYKNFSVGREIRGAGHIEKMIASPKYPAIAKAKALRNLASIRRLIPKPPKPKTEKKDPEPNFEVLKIVKFDSRPARYTAQIRHACGETYEVTCETDVFQEFWDFRKAFFEATPNRSLNMIKQPLWEHLISPERVEIEVRPAPEEASSKGAILAELETFLENKKESPEPGELKSFAGYNDHELYFTLVGFRGHIRASGMAKVTDREIVHVLRNAGWTDHHRRVGDKTMRLWVKEYQKPKKKGDEGGLFGPEEAEGQIPLPYALKSKQ